MEYLKYLPLEMREIEEYKQLGIAGEPEITSARTRITQVAENHFYSSADEYGCSRYEKIMDLETNESETLAVRRLLIIEKANNALPYTLWTLERKLVTILGNGGFTMNMDYANYTLTILLSKENKTKLDYVKSNIVDTIPANIVLVVDIKYNSYNSIKAKPLTYNQIKTKGITYTSLKEDLLED